MLQDHLKEQKEQKFREQAAKQRDKIKVLKGADPATLEEAEPISKPLNLTEANLKAQSTSAKAPPSQAPSQKSGKAKKAIPAWATTEKQQESAKEAEIDELLEFAYELDYEKYMEDQEVRMALAVIKDRVKEITKDVDWKQKMADEWNQANEDENIEAIKSQ